MLSSMESSDLATTIHEADRAAAAPFIDYPPVPKWYPAFMGAFFAALAVSAHLMFGEKYLPGQNVPQYAQHPFAGIAF